MPNDGPPTSSQARLMPTRKQTITRIAIVSTAPGLLELVTIRTASNSWITNVTASVTRNTASRTVLHRTWPPRSRPSRTSDSSAATKNPWTVSGPPRRFGRARRGLGAEGVEFGDRLGRQDQAGRCDVLAQVGQGRGAGDEDHRGRAPQQPGQRDLLRGRAEPGGHAVQRRRLERGEAAEREIRGVGDALGRAPVDQGVVASVGEVVEVLHGDDGCDGLR